MPPNSLFSYQWIKESSKFYTVPKMALNIFVVSPGE